jgi:hypothetical protein
MRKIPKVLHRFRLMTGVVALVLLLGALYVTPAQTSEMCQTDCVGWTQTQGCVKCQRCCYYPDSGRLVCTTVSNRQCF